MDHVFLDTAGCSLMPAPVVEAMVAHLRREAEVGGVRAAEERADDLARLRTSLGTLLGAPAAAIALTDGATRGWNQFVGALPWRDGDRVLVTGTEYAANAIALLQRARSAGVSVEVVPSGPDGTPDLDALAGLLDERVRLVSLVHVPSHTGQVNPVRPVVELAHAAGALVILDACQSVGQLVVDVAELGVDALVAAGRKWLRGPRGTGLLYVRPDLDLEPAVIDGFGAAWTAPDSYVLAPDARRFELYEASVATRLGLGVAVDLLLLRGPAQVEAAVRSRAARLRAGLAAIDGVSLHDRGPDLSGIVTFTLDGVAAADVRAGLLERGVTVGVRPAQAARFDRWPPGVDAVVRASPHHFVPSDGLDRAVGAVAAVADIRHGGPPRIGG